MIVTTYVLRIVEIDKIEMANLNVNGANRHKE